MHDVAAWQHNHDYRIDSHRQSETRTHWVIALTLVTMLVELVAGTITGSMALLADGWHMASQVSAYRQSLRQIPQLEHVTVEINYCDPNNYPHNVGERESSGE